ncbi:fluoride efflux transporter CrcB [Clostridium sp. CX1]|uniref:fluoride efflux transporter CrcB n=1 Tax=Clostridium sp. CX1 TaxID=2978346 RepID=UPI0021BF0508|nr:fluoride efflux transporter CrcB [Clostridium sp. CX1]MCT8977380.1 fluoride efflux transporter CrcB [Clostridium sp. CX1]
MKKYIFIGAGGFLGAIIRFWIKTTPINSYKEFIPINTLFINITGSFLLALITVTALEIIKIDESLRLGICTGLLGAYTTFSTMCKEAVELLSKGYYFSSLSYITNSVVLGLASAYLGAAVARELIPKLFPSHGRNDLSNL